MAQEVKHVVYNCNNYCRICDVEVYGKVKLGNYNIFTGKKAKNAQIAERLSKVLECELEKDDCSSIICINCYRAMEKLEKANEILRNELPKFKASHDQTCLSHSEKKLENMSRFKRCHTGSPLSAEKPPKQQVRSTEARSTKNKVKLVFPPPSETVQIPKTTKTNYSVSETMDSDSTADMYSEENQHQILGCFHDEDDIADPLPTKRSTVVQVRFYRCFSTLIASWM